MDPINASSTTTVQPTSSAPVKTTTGAPAGDVATTGNAANASAASTSSASSAAGSSTVTTISSISTQLLAAQATSSSEAVFSTSKVNEIKLAISEGRFQVNSEKVANGLLDSVSELLNSRRQ